MGKQYRFWFAALTFIFVAAIMLAGCGSKENATDAKQEETQKLSGTVMIDGSSTVFPITEAVAEEFMAKYPDVRVTVGVSGTGGGFKRWVAGETDINDASRPIKDQEQSKAAELGIEPIEIPVAYDGITIVVNSQNDWVDHLTVDELKKIWAPDSNVKKWSEVRQGWPEKEIKLYGPGPDSGTFGYFTEAINGKEGASRAEYTASEDDNMLVQGVAGDKYSLGYFGYAYYVENQEKIKAVAIDGGKGAVMPSEQTINDGTYAPLSRPVFIYVSSKALAEKPEIKEFVKFYLTEGKEFVSQVGYIKLPEEKYIEGLAKVESK